MRRFLAALFASTVVAIAASPRSAEYEAVQHQLAGGWNTWDTHSVTAQVLLPEAFTLRVGLKHNTALNADAFLADALIGRQDKNAEQVTPGPHTWDGSYTELRVAWHGHAFLLQTAHDGEDLVLLATPLPSNPPTLPPTLVISAGVLWNQPGTIAHRDDHLEFEAKTRHVPVYWCGPAQAKTDVPISSPYFAAIFEGPAGISTGRAFIQMPVFNQ